MTADHAPAVHAALRRVPTQSRSRDKVDRALDAAHALLEREGVEALSLSRVAKEADVSVGALYQYLPDRETIVAALTATYHAQHEARMDQLVEAIAAAQTVDPVGAVIDGIAGVYQEQRRTRLLRAELQAASEPARIRAHKNRMVEKVRRLLETQGLVDPGAVARTLFFAADGLMHEAFAEDPDGDPAVLAELKHLARCYLSSRFPPGA